MERRKYRWRDKPKNDRTGETHGRLTVVGFSHYELKKSGGRKLIWNCVCECGSKLKAENSNLISGSKKSCGCLLRDQLKIVHKGNIKEYMELEFR